MNLGNFEYYLIAKLRDVGPKTPSELLEALEDEWPVAYTTLTTTLYRLERKGLVTSRRLSLHKRQFFIDEEGEAFRLQARNLWERLLTTFGPASVAHLLEGNESLAVEEIEALLDEIQKVRRGEA